MTLKDALDKYKVLNSTTPYTDAQITEMVQTLDRMVQTEILHTFPYVETEDEETGVITKTDGIIVSYSFPANQATALLLSGTPFEDVYMLYLTSMTYFNQADWMRYSNAKGMFNTRYMDAMYYHSRNFKRPQTNKIRNYW